MFSYARFFENINYVSHRRRSVTAGFDTINREEALENCDCSSIILYLLPVKNKVLKRPGRKCRVLRCHSEKSSCHGSGDWIWPELQEQFLLRNSHRVLEFEKPDLAFVSRAKMYALNQWTKGPLHNGPYVMRRRLRFLAHVLMCIFINLNVGVFFPISSKTEICSFDVYLLWTGCSLVSW